MPGTPDWYPSSLSELIAWQLRVQYAGCRDRNDAWPYRRRLIQADQDSNNIFIMLTYEADLRTYEQAWTAWRDNVLTGDPDDAPIPAPTSPEPPDFGGTDPLPGIRTRTRGYANTIKASPGYETSVGEDYGIVAPAPAPAGPVSIISATALIDSDVAVKISKAGYQAVAVDMRRNEGAFEQIGVSLTTTFVDETAPLVVGQPEVREYRIQGLEGNARVGAVSSTVSVSTTP